MNASKNLYMFFRDDRGHKIRFFMNEIRPGEFKVFHVSIAGPQMTQLMTLNVDTEPLMGSEIRHYLDKHYAKYNEDAYRNDALFEGAFEQHIDFTKDDG